MSNRLEFQVKTLDGSISTVSINPNRLIVAGWAGRDLAAVQHHIDELAAIGVAPPSQVPLFYQVSANQIIQSVSVSALGTESSGEVEPLLVRSSGQLFVGLGSDHTDRKTETWSVAHSKQICPKPVAPTLWPWNEVAPHWDEVRLSSWIRESDKQDWVLYQDGKVSGLRNPLDLAELSGQTEADLVMLCGTIPVIGPIRSSVQFKMQIEDPVLGRCITHEYQVEVLPIAI